MGKRQAIKNIKRVSCRFDMDVPEERRAWQILQGSYQEPPDGKKQDYTSIIAKAMTGYYDRGGETSLTHEELLAKVQESIRREAEGIKKSLAQTPFPMMYPYMQVLSPGMQNAAAVQQDRQEQTGIQQGEEIINEAALDFMDSFIGG